MQASCSRCGAVEEVDDDGLPVGWSLVTDDRGMGYVCLACTRLNVRAIESKLPEEWW